MRAQVRETITSRGGFKENENILSEVRVLSNSVQGHQSKIFQKYNPVRENYDRRSIRERPNPEQ